jgi:hypothetical protein
VRVWQGDELAKEKKGRLKTYRRKPKIASPCGQPLPNNSGSLAIFAAIWRALSRVRSGRNLCKPLMPAMLLRRPLCTLDKNVTRIKPAAASGLAQSIPTTMEFFRLGFELFASQYEQN